MKKTLAGIVASVLIFAGAGNCLARDSVRMKEGVGKEYYVIYNNRKAFQVSAREDVKEDAWLCFNTMCYDVGFNEADDEVSVDGEELMRIINLNNYKGNVYLRHIHPAKLKRYKDNISPPLGRDITGHLNFQEYFKKLGVNVISEVVVEDGWWRYEGTFKLKSKLDGSHKGDVLNEHLKDFYRINSEPIPRDEKIRKFISSAAEKGIKLSYTPFGEETR